MVPFSSPISTNSSSMNPINLSLGIANSCLAIVSTCANCLILYCFYANEKLRIPSNYFIAALAIVDVYNSIFPQHFFTVYMIFEEWPLGDFFCDMWMCLDYAGCSSSQYIVLLITTDRYFSARHPIAYRQWQTKSKVITLILFANLLPLALFGYLSFGWPLLASSGQKTEQKSICFAEFSAHSTVNAATVIGVFWSTSVVIFVMYAAIFHAAYSLNDRMMPKTSNHVSHILNKSEIDFEVAKSRDHTLGFLKRYCQSDTSVKMTPSADATILPETKKLSMINMITFIRKDQNNFSGVNILNLDKNSNCILNDNCMLSDEPSASGNSAMKSSTTSKTFHSNQHATAFRMASRRSRGSLQRFKGRMQNKTAIRAQKARRTIGCILISYVISWTPFHVVSLLTSAYCSTVKWLCVSSNLYSWVYWMCYLNSLLNPICYAVTIRGINRMICKRLPSHYNV